MDNEKKDYEKADFDEKISVLPNLGVNYTLPSVTLRRSLNDKVAKIKEEADEVVRELGPDGRMVPGNVLNTTKEIIDVLVSCESALNHLAHLGVPVGDMIRKVYEKNDLRGYYTPGGTDYVRDQPASG